MSSIALVRETLLEEAALEAARSWARGFLVMLTSEGRRAEGGWPGTMREARVRAGAEASRALSVKSMTALTHDELGRLTRVTYNEARRSWRVSSTD